MTVAMTGDHRGFKLKEALKQYLAQSGYSVKDYGTQDEKACDYSDMAVKAGKAVTGKQADCAIMVCGTGIGMSIAANKLLGIRAALCHDEITARISRQHNDANVLCLSGDLLGETIAKQIVDVWLTTDFEGGRHVRRLEKVTAIEQAERQQAIEEYLKAHPAQAG